MFAHNTHGVLLCTENTYSQIEKKNITKVKIQNKKCFGYILLPILENYGMHLQKKHKQKVISAIRVIPVERYDNIRFLTKMVFSMLSVV